MATIDSSAATSLGDCEETANSGSYAPSGSDRTGDAIDEVETSACEPVSSERAVFRLIGTSGAVVWIRSPASSLSPALGLPWMVNVVRRNKYAA